MGALKRKLTNKFRVLYEGFEISCDGKKVHLFKHRMSYQKAEYLQFTKAAINLTEVHWECPGYETCEAPVSCFTIAKEIAFSDGPACVSQGNDYDTGVQNGLSQ